MINNAPKAMSHCPVHTVRIQGFGFRASFGAHAFAVNGRTQESNSPIDRKSACDCPEIN